MRKIYENLDFTIVGHFQSILEENGIGTLVKNLGSSSVMGEVPFTHAYPELWIADDADFAEALKILEPYYRAMKETRPEWECECGETIAGSYGACWNCGATATAPAPSAVETE